MRIRRMLSVMLVAGVTASAYAQPGDRTALVYGARVAGDSVWQFGSLSAQSTLSAPVTIEVAVFCFRNQGVGLSTCVFKTYVDTLGTNSVQIVEDLSNGVPASGVDGRVGAFNSGPAFYQTVYTNRNAAIPGAGFRISSPTDGPDVGAPGGISVHQEPPPDAGALYVTADGVLTYRFNVIASPVAFPSTQDIHVFTPVNRVNTYNVHNRFDSRTTTSLLSLVETDQIDLNISWVPAPGPLAAFGLAAVVSRPRRRRAFA